MRQIVGVFLGIQGLMGFVGGVFFDGPKGLLPRWVDLPAWSYLGLVVAGAILVIWGEEAKKSRS
ncbi:MAG: hypothetical protein HOY71_45250 [Nonomuraea sp.]|nr:hypothetical protein [Nonomuraea sp.]